MRANKSARPCNVPSVRRAKRRGVPSPSRDVRGVAAEVTGRAALTKRTRSPSANLLRVMSSVTSAIWSRRSLTTEAMCSRWSSNAPTNGASSSAPTSSNTGRRDSGMSSNAAAVSASIMDCPRRTASVADASWALHPLCPTRSGLELGLQASPSKMRRSPSSTGCPCSRKVEMWLRMAQLTPVVAGAFERAAGPRDLLPGLHHPRVSLDLVVVPTEREVAREAPHVSFLGAKARRRPRRLRDPRHRRYTPTERGARSRRALSRGRFVSPDLVLSIGFSPAQHVGAAACSRSSIHSAVRSSTGRPS